MINNLYALQIALIWGLFIAFYYLFLGNITFFKSNRFYLLGALILGLVVPLIQPYLIQENIGIQPIVLPTIVITNQPVLSEISIQSKAVQNWPVIIYWIGFIVMFLRFMKGVIGLIWIIVSNQKKVVGQFVLVNLEKKMSPFSFFNYIFIYEKEALQEKEWEPIFIHESTHSSQWHSIDIMFTEILKIIFWWNPFIYFYQKTLQEVHEFEADNAVNQIKNTKQYGLLLMKQSLSGNQAALSNGFINSQLKKRIIMMTKKRSSELTKIRYIWSFPLLVILVLISFNNGLKAQNIEPEIVETQIDTIFSFDTDTYKESMETVKSYIYKNQNIDQIAVLKGCEKLSTEEDQQACSSQKLLQSIFANISYPQEARDAKIEGLVWVKINIRPENVRSRNSIVRYNIVKDPGFGLGAEVLRTLLAANLKWNPAEHNDADLDVQLLLPIKFKLSSNSKTDDKKSIIESEFENGFQAVKMTFDARGLEVSFKSERDVSIQVFDMMGRTILMSERNEGLLKAKEVNSSQIIIVVLEDNEGNRVVRKLMKL